MKTTEPSTQRDDRGRRPSPRPSPRLSLPLDRLAERYDVVVVGSGYGGAVTAARMAERGRSVCVLERGREHRPGDFPSTLAGAVRDVQLRIGPRRRGRETALYELVADHEVSVLVGCGLGGTSLINAGVALRPPDRTFDDPRWPEALRARGNEVLGPYYDRAEHMLGSTPYPDDWPVLPKFRALERAAQAVGATVARPRINVAFTDGPNAAGVEMAACNLCGDCVAGCNHGAKGTTLVNYLPVAVRHGAHLFTEASVTTVTPAAGGGWTVAFDALASGRRRFGGPSLFVHADVVVLAAGTLGSTGILFRSQAQGLPLSPRLGERFSGNGDVLAFAYDADDEVRGFGAGRGLRPRDQGAGPCITGLVDLRGDAADGPGLVVEEGAIPGALASLMPTAFALAVDPEEGTRRPLATRLWRAARAAAGTVARRRGGPADRTLTYLVMSDDGGDGCLRPDGDTVVVDWAGAGDHPVFDANDRVLRRATAGIGATFVPNPLWAPALHEPLVTVHPLGGCPMGDDGAHGVVDDRGRVFVGAGGEVHDGLLVADGAIVPRPLGVNPLLTISALAERAADLLAAERGWGHRQSVTVTAPPASPARSLGSAPASATSPDGAAPADGAGTAERPVPVDGDGATPMGAATSGGASGPAAPALRLTFTERMRGFAGRSSSGDPAAGETQGRADGTPIEFLLTVGVDDVAALLDDPSLPGTLSGTVTAPALAPRRLRVVTGSFRLVEHDPTHVETWHMRYSMVLATDDAADPRRFRFEGVKKLHDRAGFDAWADTTTLHVTIADEATGDPLVSGVMRLGVGDFARQLTTMRVVGDEPAWRRCRWVARFGARFLRSLGGIYGGPLDDVGKFPSDPLRPVPMTGGGARRLQLPLPESRWCDGDDHWYEGDEVGDDAWLRLTRFEGGRRGPVVLAPGFGMSATSFLVDTVRENLVEHLVARGYDTWLLDYRASIDLPSSHTEFTLDEIATRDWPAAVAEVLRATGAGSVQALGHCVGSASLMMALGAGLEGVRSAVCMQFTLHPMTSMLNQLKAQFEVGHMFGRIGLDHVQPFRGPSVLNTLLDLGLRALPLPAEERCGKAVCRWVNAIYGCTHAHDQLDEATHERLDDMFGVGNVESLNHIGLMLKAQLAVDSHDRPAYTSRPERFRLPILLVQGERNGIFHPEGSRKTLRWLQSHNEPLLYDRTVLPGYAHLDALIGRSAAADVFPLLSGHLDRFNQ